MKWLFMLLAVTPLLAQTQELVKTVSPTGITKQATTNEEGVQWIDNLNWEQIKAKAKVEGKFIFVDAYATWCTPCKLMDKNVFPDKSVADELNSRFLSVKMQMDETDKDNEKIKARYTDARYLNDKYKPEGYPCFLFFAPDGSLAHRGLGFHAPAKFIALLNEALTDPVGKYEDDVQKFRNGKLELNAMPPLARLARKNRENELAENIAKNYKEKYLNLLKDVDAFTGDNLLFVADFSYLLLTSHDRYFWYFYNNENRADSLMNLSMSDKGQIQKIADRIVTGIIKKEEITDKLYYNGKPITNLKPGWKEIHASISKKYGDRYADKYFPDEQINYYRVIRDCKRYVEYVNEKIGKVTPKAGGKLFYNQFGDSWGLNVYAWDLFKFCSEKKWLMEGLRWSDESIKLSVQEKKDSSAAIQYLDTKANLLYRLGKVQEGIDLEQKAVSLLTAEDALRKEYMETIEKMKKGLPTWPNPKN